MRLGKVTQALIPHMPIFTLMKIKLQIYIDGKPVDTTLPEALWYYPKDRPQLTRIL